MCVCVRWECPGQLTGGVLERAEHLALGCHALDVRVLLQRQQVAGRHLPHVDQLKVAGEVRGRVLPGNDVPLQEPVPDVPQGTVDVQAPGFGGEVSREGNDVLWGGERRARRPVLLC